MKGEKYKVKIDKVKLEKALEISGFTKAKFSESLGHDPSFISMYNNENLDTMQKSDVFLIKSLYGIDISYVEPVETTGIVVSEDTYSVIYNAVFNAICHSFKAMGLVSTIDTSHKES